MTELIGSLAAAFLISLIVTPIIRILALKIRAIDKPEARKVHEQVMPRMGGLAVCFAFWVAVVCTREMTREIYGLLGGGFLICLVGLWDDLRGVSPRIKLLFQIAAACVAIGAGIRVDFITNIFAGEISLYYLSYPVTILWIIGITNAVNLIDGLDGLAAGVSAIAAVTIGIVAVLEGYSQVGMLAFILAAAVLGFLRYNFYPAKIFMGDTGALFLGYNLSILAILGLTKTTTVMISLFLPVIILGIPIIDTLFAIIRRYFNGKPIFSPDKEHLHHRLLALGLTHRKTVLVFYGVSALLGASAVVMTRVTTPQGMLLMIAVTMGVFIAADRAGVLRSARLKGREKKSYQHLAK